MNRACSHKAAALEISVLVCEAHGDGSARAHVKISQTGKPKRRWQGKVALDPDGGMTLPEVVSAVMHEVAFSGVI